MLHLVGAASLSETAYCVAIASAVGVAVHSSGVAVLGLFEVTAIAATVRLVQLAGAPLRAGAALAGAALIAVSGWVGLSLDVSMAAVLIWWSGWIVGGAVLIVLARRPRPAPVVDRAQSRDRARLAHRAAYAALTLSPPVVRRALRRRVFDAMFGLSDDPWDYASTAYEQRKRLHLIAALGTRYATVVEVGCADGHNLVAMARALPDTTVIGTDVSSRAVAVARHKSDELSNVAVFTTDEVEEWTLAASAQPQCVVLAEVLYYMVTTHAIRESLTSIQAATAPDCDFILLHGAADARALHRRAARALNLRIVREDLVDDPVRPFVISVARALPSGAQDARDHGDSPQARLSERP